MSYNCLDRHVEAGYGGRTALIWEGNNPEEDLHLTYAELLLPKKEKKEPLLLEIQNFLDAIDGRSELLVKPEHAINVTKVAEAALLSSQKGTPIYLDLR